MSSLFGSNVDDQRFALCLLQLLTRADAPQPSIYFVHDGVPIPKARARFSKTGPAYTPKRTSDAEKDLAWVLKANVPQRPMVGPVALVAMFYLPTQHRCDGDNLLKLLKDSGNRAGIWHDDSQVTAHAVVVGLDAARPRTVIAMAPAVSGLHRLPPKPKGQRSDR
jgi:Holliday junction resolvase RusA-like endonuclease